MWVTVKGKESETITFLVVALPKLQNGKFPLCIEKKNSLPIYHIKPHNDNILRNLNKTTKWNEIKIRLLCFAYLKIHFIDTSIYLTRIGPMLHVCNATLTFHISIVSRFSSLKFVHPS